MNTALSVTSQTDRGGAQTSFAYNAVNLLVQETDALGQATDYTYNSRGWLTDKDLPDPDGAGPLGRPSSTYGYDYAGNLTSEGQPNYEGVPLQYAYDAAGRRTQRKHQGDTFSTTYTYDNLNRLIKEVDPLLCSTSYTSQLARTIISIDSPRCRSRVAGLFTTATMPPGSC